MTIAISLSSRAQEQLASQAGREGIDLATLAARVLEAEADRLDSHGPHSNPNQATLDLLAKWAAEEETDDPAELQRREREVAEFMDGMNQSRLECAIRRV